VESKLNTKENKPKNVDFKRVGFLLQATQKLPRRLWCLKAGNPTAPEA